VGRTSQRPRGHAHTCFICMDLIDWLIDLSMPVPNSHHKFQRRSHPVPAVFVPAPTRPPILTTFIFICCNLYDSISALSFHLSIKRSSSIAKAFSNEKTYRLYLLPSIKIRVNTLPTVKQPVLATATAILQWLLIGPFARYYRMHVPRYRGNNRGYRNVAVLFCVTLSSR